MAASVKVARVSDVLPGQTLSVHIQGQPSHGGMGGLLGTGGLSGWVGTPAAMAGIHSPTR